jgi:hypothetical protein
VIRPVDRMIPPPAQQATDLPLFGFPTMPAVTEAEDRFLELPETTEGRYAEWRKTDDGRRLFEIMRWRAVALVRAGEQRVGAKALFEWVRSTHHVSIDNTFTALVGRELLDCEPELKDKIHLRERRAA